MILLYSNGDWSYLNRKQLQNEFCKFPTLKSIWKKIDSEYMQTMSIHPPNPARPTLMGLQQDSQPSQLHVGLAE
jgi:hypothetical protein